jgi:hypothetical protein
MQKEQLTTDTNMTNNQTIGGIANQLMQLQIRLNQKVMRLKEGANDNASNPLEQIGETISGIFGGGGN